MKVPEPSWIGGGAVEIGTSGTFIGEAEDDSSIGGATLREGEEEKEGSGIISIRFFCFCY